MKVLVCIPCLLTGGTEVQTLNLVRALVEGGHEVVTACYFEHQKNMVRAYEEAGSQVVLLSPEGVRIGGVKGLIFLYNGLRKIVEAFRPDVAHVQYMAPGAQPIAILRLLGIKTILATVHTNSDIYGSLKLIHFLQKHVLRAWTCITMKAEEGFFGSSRMYSQDFNLQKRNHFTIYNSLPYKMCFDSSHQRNEVATIGIVSRLEKIKGMDMVIPAFAMVHEQHPEVKLIVVGDGSLKEQMQAQAHELGIWDSVEWAGRQPQEELYKWYGRMDIVLMPSHSEGFGLTAIEAMANGCVVVASNTGGLPEVVKDGKVGLLHETGNTNDLAEKILTLINNSSQFAILQADAKDYVQKYSFENYSNAINNLYSKIQEQWAQ